VAPKKRKARPFPAEQLISAIVPKEWSEIPVGELREWIAFLERVRDLYARHHREAVHEFGLRPEYGPEVSGLVISPASIESAERFGEF